MKSSFGVRRLGFGMTLLGILCLLPFTSQALDKGTTPPLRVLILGSGPDLANNQVAIESNVRYVGKLLPTGAVRTTLFADGDVNRPTVLFEEDLRSVSLGERLFRMLMQEKDVTHLRKPNLGAKLDGALSKTDIHKSLTQIGKEMAEKAPERQLLLYFTGHGSLGDQSYENNVYDLWGKEEAISVQELAQELAALPAHIPLTLVMVQCFSGSFANLLFESGDPKGDLLNRDIAGFFASIKEMEAAGCSPAVNEEEYHDFTSYFFAALTGRDRMGKRVTGADYNKDGRIGMDEAYCYTLIHDESIDIPTCTSDIFLRRFVPMEDNDLFQTPYSDVLKWASPAQKAVLVALSDQLSATGEKRLATCYNKMNELRYMTDPYSGRDRRRRDNGPLYRRFAEKLREGRQQLLQQWPTLRSPDSPEYKAIREKVVAQLTRQGYAGKWKDLLDTDDEVDKNMEESQQIQVLQARRIRFVRMGKSVILAHQLRAGEDTALKARYERLLQSEGRTLLPPVKDFSP